MNTTTFTVTGMTCGNCERHVSEEVGTVAGVTNVEVSAETGILRVTGASDLGAQAVIAAVEAAGYTAVTA